MRWHYTADKGYWEKINAEGVIRCTDILIEAGERPVVWFSTEPSFEQTAKKRLEAPDGSESSMTFAEMHERCGIVRIGVADEDAPVSWRDFCDTSGISSRTARALVKVAKEQGARPHNWYVSYGPVPRERWQTVEKWDGAAWRPIPSDEWQR